MHFFLVGPTLDETEEASIIARLTKLHIQVASGTSKAMTLTHKIRHCFFWKLDNLMTIHNNYQDQVPISVFSSFQLQHIQDQVPIYVFPSFQLQHEVNDLVPNNRNPEAKYTHTAQHKISWFYYGCTKKSWITQPAFKIEAYKLTKI